MRRILLNGSANPISQLLRESTLISGSLNFSEFLFQWLTYCLNNTLPIDLKIGCEGAMFTNERAVYASSIIVFNKMEIEMGTIGKSFKLINEMQELFVFNILFFYR